MAATPITPSVAQRSNNPAPDPWLHAKGENKGILSQEREERSWDGFFLLLQQHSPNVIRHPSEGDWMVKQTTHLDGGVSPLLFKHSLEGVRAEDFPFHRHKVGSFLGRPTVGCCITKLCTLPVPFVKKPHHLFHSNGISEQVGHDTMGSNRKDCAEMQATYGHP